MKVAIARTCFWQEVERSELADISGRQAIVWLVRDRDGVESFEATFNDPPFGNSTPTSIIRDQELAVVIQTLDERLDVLAAAGALPAEGDTDPQRIDLGALFEELPAARELIEGDVARHKELPPPTPEVDPAIVRELLRVAFTVLTEGKQSKEQLDAAMTDATEAIRNLPCDGCGGIHWPVLDKPPNGSPEWWEDPGAYFACRTCGHYLGDAFAYPYIRQANDRYPVEGVVRRTEDQHWRGVLPDESD